MLVRACHALYLLAELLCLLGLLLLCVFKVQHFLSQPVTTAVSYQRSRSPAITICHKLSDEEAVQKLNSESEDSYFTLWGESVAVRFQLLDARDAIDSYLSSISEVDNTPVASVDGLSVISATTLHDKLQVLLNTTETIYHARLYSVDALHHPQLNETGGRLEEVLNASIRIIQQILDVSGQGGFDVLEASKATLEYLVNATDEIDRALSETPELRKPLPVRLLAEGTRRVDQFVISCVRGNTSCMPGQGGTWHLHHVLETSATCYTLLAPSEQVSGEESTVVLELRGNKWKREEHEDEQEPPPSPDVDVTDWPDPGENATMTTLEVTAETMTESTAETGTEVTGTAAKNTTGTAPSPALTDESWPDDGNVTLEPTFYPPSEYNDSILVPYLNYSVYEQPPIIIMPECPAISHSIEAADPMYIKNFHQLNTQDSIQYVMYKVLLHSASVPLISAPDGLRERSFEIYNNQDWVEVDVRMEELRSLNRDDRPCQPDGAYSRGSCLLQCVEAAHARAAGCQLESAWPGSDQGLPQCVTADQLSRLRTKLEVQPDCPCPHPCRQGRVSAVVQASSRSDEDHAVTVTVRLDGAMQVIEESVAYTAWSLLTDFGGNLGLTMGVSLLTIVELLKKITFGILDRESVEAKPSGETDDQVECMV